MQYLFLALLFVFSNVNALAQTNNKKIDGCVEYGGTWRTILKSDTRRFKIKALVGANSGTSREADYVEFKTMEKIPSTDNPPRVLFDKDTSIYGVVTHRKARRFPLRRGKIEIRLKPLVNWNGDEIQMGIFRHGAVKNPDKPKRRTDPCKESRDVINAERPCVAGKGNAAVGLLVTGGAVAGAVAVPLLADDKDTAFIAGTVFFSAAKELANLLAGTDVEVAKDEIFDLVIQTPTVCAFYEKPEAAPSPTPSLQRNLSLRYTASYVC
jgi:hypothetical protein